MSSSTPGGGGGFDSLPADHDGDSPVVKGSGDGGVEMTSKRASFQLKRPMKITLTGSERTNPPGAGPLYASSPSSNKYGVVASPTSSLQSPGSRSPLLQLDTHDELHTPIGYVPFEHGSPKVVELPNRVHSPTPSSGYIPISSPTRSPVERGVLGGRRPRAASTIHHPSRQRVIMAKTEELKQIARRTSSMTSAESSASARESSIGNESDNDDEMLALALGAVGDGPEDLIRVHTRKSYSDSKEITYHASISGSGGRRSSDSYSEAPSVTKAVRARRPSTVAYTEALKFGSFYNRKHVLGSFSGSESPEEPYINPHNQRYRVWILALTAFAVYNLVFVPLRVAFEQDDQSTIPFFVVDMLQDILFVIDIFLSFRKGFFTYGVLVTTPSRIFKNYIYSWFIVDMAAALPYDLIQVAIGRFDAAVRLPKLLRITYILRSQASMSRHTERTPGVDKGGQSARVLKLIFQIVVLNHIIACCKYGIQRLDSGAWSDADVYAEEPDSIVHQYVVSLFWTMSIVTGLGSTKVAETYAENGFTLVIMLLGVFIFAYVIGEVGALVDTVNMNRKAFQQRLHYVTRFAHDHGVPEELKQKIVKFFSYLWSVNEGYDRKKVLSHLPIAMQMDVNMFLCRSTFEATPLFKGTEKGFIPALLNHVSLMVCVPNQWIIHKSAHVGDRVYFIVEGECQVLIGDSLKQQVIKTLVSGENFGEYTALGISTKRSASIRSSTYCTLLVLEKKDLLNTMKKFPESGKIVRERSELQWAVNNMQNREDKTGLLKKFYEGTHKWARVRRFVLTRKIIRWMKPSNTLRVKGMFSPNDPKILMWKRVILCVILYNLFCIPFRIAFFPRLKGLFMPLDYLGDLLLIANVFVKLRTGFIERGNVVYDHRRVKEHYYRRTFVTDVLSVIPLDFCMIFTGYSLLWRLPKLLLTNALISYLAQRTKESNAIAKAKLARLCFALALLAHWIACFYYMFTKWEGFAQPLEGESEDDDNFADVNWLPVSDIEDAPLLHQYMRSMYFAVTVLTGVGTHPTPRSTAQVAFSTLGITVGVFVIAYLIGSVSSVLANLDVHGTQFAKEVISSTGYLNHVNAPPSITRRVRDYFVNLWSAHHGVDPNVVLESLPKPLRTEVAWHMCGDLVKDISYFRTLSLDFFRDLVYRVTFQYFPPREFIYHQGHIGFEMFFIKSGLVELIIDEDLIEMSFFEPYSLLQDGSFFGESVFFTKKRILSARSRTPLCLLVLSKSQFVKLAQAHPSFLITVKGLHTEREKAVHAKIGRTNRLSLPDDIVELRKKLDLHNIDKFSDEEYENEEHTEGLKALDTMHSVNSNFGRHDSITSVPDTPSARKRMLAPDSPALFGPRTSKTRSSSVIKRISIGNGSNKVHPMQ